MAQLTFPPNFSAGAWRYTERRNIAVLAVIPQRQQIRPFRLEAILYRCHFVLAGRAAGFPQSSAGNSGRPFISTAFASPPGTGCRIRRDRKRRHTVPLIVPLFQQFRVHLPEGTSRLNDPRDSAFPLPLPYANRAPLPRRPVGY